jgi:D-2-hydroxyacid dehydrogenase (NADP+)
MAAGIEQRDELTIGFAHAAYRLGEEFASRGRRERTFEVRSLKELEAGAGEADILVVSGLWRNRLVERAPRLKFVQSISAGTDQFSRDLFQQHGIRLASGQGVNERAVAEHAMALILSLTRQLHLARDNQARQVWRGMVPDRAKREDELAGKTLLVVGLGRIGTRLARLGRAFDMRVVGIKRHPMPMADVDVVLGHEHLMDALSDADFVALACPLTPETEGMLGGVQLAAMKSSAYLINVARGRIVNEVALLTALRSGSIAGAALDCFYEEPLSPESPVWGLENAIVTPHTAGETRRYEANLVDILLENLGRFGKDAPLLNQIV